MVLLYISGNCSYIHYHSVLLMIHSINYMVELKNIGIVTYVDPNKH